ncbi:hypothetical protein OESDEN_20163 [Oesophagostomum dentatum]|uniref:Reverse transcriptase/retrotransposon-derived protein RNase H-like domain-containing protein n=1 Tax=Oesophagostomum dentatum TaxID=61180 RepID=A0A0B1S5I4_OESDE|nr:hypothetical protein OESDEN_20163 [Oesophagostomum dentatum]
MLPSGGTRNAKQFLIAPKKCLLDLPLTHFDPCLPTIVAADASDSGNEAVILHKMPDGTKKTICPASRSLTPPEKNYGQIEKKGTRSDIRKCGALPVTRNVIEEEFLKDRQISHFVQMTQGNGQLSPVNRSVAGKL